MAYNGKALFSQTYDLSQFNLLLVVVFRAQALFIQQAMILCSFWEDKTTNDISQQDKTFCNKMDRRMT